MTQHVASLFLCSLLLFAPLFAQDPPADQAPALPPERFAAAQTWLAQTASCDGDTVVVDENATVDFSADVPVYSGDADLAPYFSYEKSGDDPQNWRAVFDLGGKRLLVTNNALISVGTLPGNRPNSRVSPGLTIRTACSVQVDAGAAVRVESTHADTGALTLYARDGLSVAGTVANQVQGTWGTAGNLLLGTHTGDLHIGASGRVLLKGAQQGVADLSLLVFGDGGDLNIDGLVDAWFENGRAPEMQIISFGGRLHIDGTRVLGTEADRVVASGVSVRSVGVPVAGAVHLQAREEVRVLGYTGTRNTSAPSFTTTLNAEMRGLAATVPVTVTLTNLASGNGVQVALSVAPGAGDIEAFFANLGNEALLEALRFHGDIVNKWTLNANSVNAVGGFWMQPPGGWDLAVELGETWPQDPVHESVSFEIHAPGLTWPQLTAPQAEGWALGLLVKPPSAKTKNGVAPGIDPTTAAAMRGKNDGLMRMGLLLPAFDPARQHGTVAVKTKPNLAGATGGHITLVSQSGDLILSGYALDNGNDNNAEARVVLDAADNITLQAGVPGARLIDHAGRNGAGGTSRLRARQGGITIGSGAYLLAGGTTAPGHHWLTACTGVTNNGTVTPADADTADDSGVCAVNLSLTVTAPGEGALITVLPMTVSGSVTPDAAEVRVQGTSLGGGNAAWVTAISPDQGAQTVEVTANWNGQTQSVTRNIIVDTLPPQIVLTAPDTHLAGEELVFSWQISDAVSAVTGAVRVNGQVVSSDLIGEHRTLVPVDPAYDAVLIEIDAEDAAGHGAPTTRHTVTLNFPAPTIAIHAPADGALTNAAEVLVRGTVTPADAAVAVNGIPALVDGTTWSLTLPLTGEGPIELVAAVSSRGGSAQDAVAVTRDITPPQLNLDLPATVVRGADYAYSWSASDLSGLSETLLLRDGAVAGAVPNGSGNAVATLDENVTTIVFQLSARDAAGNQAQLERTVAIQARPVDVAITTPDEGMLTNADTVVVGGTVAPADTPVTLNGEAAAVTGSTWTHTLALSGEGDITLTATATREGVSDQDQRTIQRDITPPELELTVPTEVVRGADYAYTWTVTDAAGLSETLLARDGVSLSSEPNGGGNATATLDESVTTIVYQLSARDAAGNQAQLERTVAIQARPVDVAITTPEEGTLTNADSLVVGGTVAPADTPVTLNGEAAAVTGSTWTHTLVLTEEGAVTLTAVATREGVSDQDQRTIQRDITPPELELTVPTEVVRGADYAYSWTVSDANGLGDTLLLRAGETVATEPNGSGDATATLDETVTTLVYELTATDAAGNQAQLERTVAIQARPVDVVMTEPADGTWTNEGEITVAGTISPADTPVTLNGEDTLVTGTGWTHTLALDGEGAITLTAAATREGQSDQDQRTVVRDITPPQVTLDLPESVVAGQAIAMAWTLVETNPIVRQVIEQDGNAIQEFSDDGTTQLSVATTADQAGTVTELLVRVFDRAGNSGVASGTVQIRPNNVTLTVDQPADNARFGVLPVALAGSVDPAEAVVDVDGAPVQRDGAAWTATVAPADGEHLLTMNGTLAGAQGDSVQRTIYVDTTAPVVAIDAPARLVRGLSHTIRVTTQDASTVNRVGLRVNGTDLTEQNAGEASFEITVPDDEALTSYTLIAHGIDEFDHRGETTQTIPVIDLADLDQVVITLTSPAHRDLFDQPQQTITGTVQPADAVLTQQGQAVTTDAGGNFSYPVTLGGGVNTFLFRAQREGWLPGQAKLDLYLDNSPPVVTILSPDDGFTTNQAQIEISGTVNDLYDETPALSRGGNPVALVQGRFNESGVTLQQGANTLTYTALDRFGRSGEASITVHYQGEGPQISLDHPDQIRPGAAYQVRVGLNPAEDVTRVELFINGLSVYQGENGNEHTADAVQSGLQRAIPVLAVAHDRFGNQVQAQGTIQVSFPHYVHGRVLNDATSYPVAGASLDVISPEGTTTVTTDADGFYETYVHGFPITVNGPSAAYASLRRTMTADRDAWRVPDLRLSARGSPTSGTVQGDGFSVVLPGSAGFTEVSDQGLAALLPLGYAPVAAFELTGLATAGTLTWTLNQPLLPDGTALYFLNLEADGWRVLAVASAAGGTVTADLPAGDGSYTAALIDSWSGVVRPAVNDLVQRGADLVVPASTLADSVTIPARASILDEPQTLFTCNVATAGGLLSGSRARVWATETHDRYDQTVTGPAYPLDFFTYSYRFGSQDRPDLLGGRLNVRARIPLQQDNTQRAEIDFVSVAGGESQAGFAADAAWSFGNLDLDLSAAADGPRVAHAEFAADEGLELPPRATWLGGFHLEVGGELDRSAELSLNDINAVSVILLRREEGDPRRLYVGRLTQNNGRWTNVGTSADITQSGRYTVVALDYALCEVSGVVRYEGAPSVGAYVDHAGFPWSARGDAAGGYRLAVPHMTTPQEVTATADSPRASGSLQLPATQGQDQLTGQDIVLGLRNLTLVRHNPGADQVHVVAMPTITLEFNQPVSSDRDLLASAISLNGGGADVPLEIIAEPGRYVLRVLPLQTLAAATVHTLTVSEAMRGRDGDSLAAPAQFSFTTVQAAVPRALDLSAFYLSSESDGLYLTAPGEAFAPGTQLSVFNPETGAGVTTTLIGDSLHLAVPAVRGEAVELRATDPLGNTHQRLIGLTQTGPDTFLLGSQPFALRINDELVLRMDEVSSGFNSEVRLTAADAAGAAARIGETAALEAAPAMEFVQGFVMEPVSGPLPTFKARLMVEKELDAYNGRSMVAMTFHPGFQLAADPTRPDQLSEQTLVRFHDAFNIENGEPAGKRRFAGRNTGQGKRFNLVQMMLVIEVNAMTGTQASDPVGSQVFTGIMSSQAPLNPSEHPIYDYVNCQRAAVAVQPPLEAPPFESHGWHQDHLRSGYYPLPGTHVYGVFHPNNGPPSYRLMGVADATGRANCNYFGPIASMRAVDPATAQSVVVDIRQRGNANVSSGFSILNYHIRNAEFDPLQHQVDLGNPPPPQLRSRWEVGSLQDGAFVVDTARSEELRNNRRVVADALLQLRYTLSSSLALSLDPEPRLVVSGLPEPGDPQIEGSTITWTFPAGAVELGGVVTAAATVTSVHDTQNTLNERFMIVGNGPLPDIPGAPPFVLSVKPEDEAEDVLVGDSIAIAFSEPVKNINNTTIRLNDGTGDLALRYYDQNGTLIEGDGEAFIIYAVPVEALNFDTVHTVVVDGVTDREDTAPEEVFEASFRTTEFREVDRLNATHRTIVKGVRNLTLIVTEDWQQDHFTIDVYDTRNAYDPMATVGSYQLRKGWMDAYVRMEIFLPSELEETGTGIAAGGDEALDQIPAGSILVATWQRFPSDVSNMSFYRFNGGGFDELFDLPSIEPGLVYATAKMGSYVILGYKRFGYMAGEPIVPASTLIVDVVETMENYDAVVGAAGGNRLDFESEIQNLGLVARYPLPGDASAITTFARRENDGDFVQVKPAFLVSGYGHPAIFDFDLSELPPFPGLAMPSGDPDYDARLVARTEYVGGPHGMINYNSAVSGFAYRDPVEGFREIDLAVFTDRSVTPNQIHFYEVPREGDMSTTGIQPIKSLPFGGGLYSIALDAETGLLAVSGLDNRFSMLDVRAFLETPEAEDQSGFEHLAFMFPAEERAPSRLTFISGNLYSHDTGGRSLSRTPVAPVKYRAAGWEYMDLNDWMNPVEDGGSAATPLGSSFKYAKHMVFYATDMPLDDQAAFVMEQGSFAIEVADEADITVDVAELGGNNLYSIERTDVHGPTYSYFSTTKLRETFFSQEPNRRRLREEGFIAFELKYKIEQDGRLLAEDEAQFVVAYRYPDTRYIDAYRSMGSVDVLAAMPQVNEQDHVLSNGDPRLNLTPMRAHNSDFLFETGAFGGGMVNGQMLQAAMPVWWDVGQLSAAPHGPENAHPRLVLEQPGFFQVSFEPREEGRAARATNHLSAELVKEGANWTLTHDFSMAYVLKAKADLPDYAAVFENVNGVAGSPGAQDDPDAMRYPLLRFTPATSEAPAGFIGETILLKQEDQRWSNSLKFQTDGKAVARPLEIIETVADAGRRSATLSYENKATGRLVVGNILPDGMQLSYVYDDDGYLTEVRRNGQRPLAYVWEPLHADLKLGEFVPKRLTSISRGDAETTFTYSDAGGKKIGSITTPYGNQNLTTSRGQSGLMVGATLAAAAQSYSQGVSFAFQDNQYLSRVTQPGGNTFTLTWTRQAGDEAGVFAHFLTADSRLSQTFEYDTKGRLTKHERNGGEQSWEYQNGSPGFEMEASRFTDPSGKSFAITLNAQGRRTSADGNTFEERFSASGVVYQTTDIQGFEKKAATTRFYGLTGLGYAATNGVTTRVPISETLQDAQTSMSLNNMGDMVESTEMGVHTAFSNYDDLGRAGTMTYMGGVTYQMAYAYRDGLQVATTTETGSGQVVVKKFNDRGWLVEQSESYADQTLTYTYTYDALGRLTRIRDLAANVDRYRAVYDDDSEQPVEETDYTVTHRYTKAPDFTPRITAAVRTRFGQSRTLALVTDNMGRTVQAEEEGLGVVQFAYDAWGRVITKRLLGGDGNRQVTFTYGSDRSSSIQDGIRNITETTNILDQAGLRKRTVISGAGLDQPLTVTAMTNKIGDGGGKGFQFQEVERGAELVSSRLFSSTGEDLGGWEGDFSLLADLGSLNRWGKPTQYTGTFTRTVTYDTLGRQTRTEDSDGTVAEYRYDIYGRVIGGNNIHDQDYNVDYFSGTPMPRTLTMDGENTAGGDSVVVVDKSEGEGKTRLNTWLGDSVTVDTTAQDVSYTLAQGDASGGYQQEAASGLADQATSMTGENATYQAQNAGNTMSVDIAGSNHSVSYDAMGHIRQVRENGLVRLSVRRDADFRVTQVDNDQQSYRYHYEGGNLTRITGGPHAMTLSEHNAYGQPGRISLAGFGSLSLAYHPRGGVASVTASRFGGSDIEVTADAKGDLTGYRTGNRAMVHFQPNKWGAPATMRLGSGPELNLFSGDQVAVLEMPNGVSMDVNQNGKVTEVRRPGLADYQFEYDPMGRLTRVLRDNLPRETYVYENGRLERIDPAPGPWSDQKDVAYDGEQRIAQVSSNLDGDSSFEYTSDDVTAKAATTTTNRIKQYTDPNGVVQHFSYDADGNVTRLEVEGGPSLVYGYDNEGRTSYVQADDLRVNYSDYNGGNPRQVQWQCDGCDLDPLIAAWDDQDRLTGLRGGGYALELDWSQRPDAALDQIDRVLRQGPRFREVLTPTYENDQLVSIQIERAAGDGVSDGDCSDCSLQTIVESYGNLAESLIGGMSRSVDGTPVLQQTNNADAAMTARTGSLERDGQSLALSYDGDGNLQATSGIFGENVTYAYDNTRKLREISNPEAGNYTETFTYDVYDRRVKRGIRGNGEPARDLIYVYQGSRVVAAGYLENGLNPVWTHAFGYGPLGPAFVKDLTGSGFDYFILADHLGTPFAYHQADTGRTYYTPFNPWGELLAPHPSRGPPHGGSGQVPEFGFQLPPDQVADLPVQGLSGHVADAETGLVYMHNRFYQPRLGHFLNTDTRPLDLFDPSSFDEPYAYAAANPIRFSDPDGRDVVPGAGSHKLSEYLREKGHQILTLPTPLADQWFERYGYRLYQNRDQRTGQLLFYTVFNTQRRTIDWLVTPENGGLEAFKAAGLALTIDPFFDPAYAADWEVSTWMASNSLFSGNLSEYFSFLGDAWGEALTDPFYYLNFLGGGRGNAVRPAGPRIPPPRYDLNLSRPSPRASALHKRINSLGEATQADVAILKSIRRHGERLVRGKVTGNSDYVRNQVRMTRHRLHQGNRAAAGTRFHSLNFHFVKQAKAGGFLRNLDIEPRIAAPLRSLVNFRKPDYAFGRNSRYQNFYDIKPFKNSKGHYDNTSQFLDISSTTGLTPVPLYYRLRLK
ncbi:hypothetical protein APED_02675 [Acanthopleuribacter pedis]